MEEVWPPAPTDQPEEAFPRHAAEPNERLGLVALSFTLLGMALVGLADLSRMHVIAASRHNLKLGHLFDGLGLLGALALVTGFALGTRSMDTGNGPIAAIMSFFALLVGTVVVALLAFTGGG